MNIGLIVMLLLAAAGGPEKEAALRYTADGKMIRPNNYREWIYLSSGLGMSYTPNAQAGNTPEFDSVFAAPDAYRGYMATGKWPDGTVLVLENRSSVSRGSINQSGHYQGELDGVEAHVKDERRFPGKWAFFAFGKSEQSAKAIPQQADCYSCHLESGASDTTFVQFYPTLLKVAKEKGTLKAGTWEH